MARAVPVQVRFSALQDYRVSGNPFFMEVFKYFSFIPTKDRVQDTYISYSDVWCNFDIDILELLNLFDLLLEKK